MLASCGGVPAYAPQTYTVRPHDTLYSIAWRHDLDYHELARWNRIGPDYRIEVGQVLVLRPGTPSGASSPRPAVPQAPPPPAGEPASAPASAWVWPTAHTTAPRPVPGGGILLLGQLGQPIRAAAAGRVVYLGSGLRGYGNLIIIKHGDDLLSAYAHTLDPTVREGQQVSAGEQIARMGAGAHRIPALYFEIRLAGRPVDPLSYLPAIK